MKNAIVRLMGGLLLCGLLLMGSALADNLSFNSIYATVSIPSGYDVLTRTNLTQKQEVLERHATTVEMTEDDWEDRGVLAQAWNEAGDVCIEFTAVQDEQALQYFNIGTRTADDRKNYRTLHMDGTLYGEEGYAYEAAVWKTSKSSGKFLQLTYKLNSIREVCYGYQYRTVRNGYTVTIDYKVYGRELKKADLKALETVMGTFKFTQVLNKPASFISKPVFTEEPPKETTTGKFAVKGTCDAGLRLVGTAMRMSSSDKVTAEATAGKTGKFTLNFELPSEGVWLVTVTLYRGDEIGDEKVFSVTTYQSNLLPVNMTAVPGDTVSGDSITISGKTLKGTTVQCIVSGATTYDKMVTVNGKGTFSFKIPTTKGGEYKVTLSFQKKGCNSRQERYTFTRNISEADRKAAIKAEAVKPAYNLLVEKLQKYTGRTLGYKLYVKSVSRSGDEWVIEMAMKLSGTTFKQIIAVTSTNDPGVVVGQQYQVYGTCAGSYHNEAEDKYYPCMTLLFLE